MSRLNAHHYQESLAIQLTLNEILLSFHAIENLCPPQVLIGEDAETKSRFLSFSKGHLRELQCYLEGKPELLDFAKNIESNIHELEKSPVASPAHYAKIQKLLKKTCTYFLKQVPYFKRDETLLFFLLRKQNEFDSLVGKEVLRKLLASLFEGNLTQLQTWLCKKYAEKGFPHLIAFINQWVGELQPKVSLKNRLSPSALRALNA
jgi:hypothetical protein